MLKTTNRQSLCSLACPILWLVWVFVPLAVQAGQPIRPAAASIPDDFPRFIVPGYEKDMSLLRELFWLHYQPAGPLITLWDEWMPMSTLWPARGEGPQLDAMRGRWAGALAGRGINAEGYVHTHQHDGPAHAEGWPFPSGPRPEEWAGISPPRACRAMTPHMPRPKAGSSHRHVAVH